MAVPPRIPEPPRTNPLRVLQGIALITLTCASLSVWVLSCRTQGTVDEAERAVEDIRDATRRIDRDTRDLDPTLKALQDAARRLLEIDRLTP